MRASPSQDAVVVVHSAGSGIGRMLTQLAARRGGRVIATVSRAHKAGAARQAGAWQVLVRDGTEDLGAAIRDLASGNGVDIAFDGTGKNLVRRERLGPAPRRASSSPTATRAGTFPRSRWGTSRTGCILVHVRASGPELTGSGASARSRCWGGSRTALRTS
jgi:threonine dehydrogenase-like Zn-dependent dehydrogenase